MKTFIFDILMPILAVMALIWMQVLLSGHDNKKMGWILPSIFLGMSMLWLLVGFTMALPNMADLAISPQQILAIVLIVNIPTGVLTIVHLVVQKRG